MRLIAGLPSCLDLVFGLEETEVIPDGVSKPTTLCARPATIDKHDNILKRTCQIVVPAPFEPGVDHL